MQNSQWTEPDQQDFFSTQPQTQPRPRSGCLSRGKRRLRFTVLVLVSCLFLGTTTGPGIPGLPAAQAAENPIAVQIDGRNLTFDVPPALESGRVLVPFRLIAAGLGVDVQWVEATRTVDARYGGVRVLLPIGSAQALVSGNPLSLDVPARIMDGRTLVPLRFFAEAFGAGVHWDSSLRRVTIHSPRREMEIMAFYALGSSAASSWTDLFGLPYPDTATGRTGHLSHVLLGWYSLDSAGNLLTNSSTGWQRPSGWERVLDEMQAYRLNTEMVIHATDMDGRITTLMADPAARNRFATAVAAEATHYGGVNLNLEGMGLSQRGSELIPVRDQFTQLVRDVRGQLAPHQSLSLSIHAPNSSYLGYDYQALGTIADRIIIMAYDYGPRPEPNDRVAEAIALAKTQVPGHKLILGISSPSETPDSMRQKISLAKADNLGGVALWRLGIIGQDKWDILEQTITPIR